MSIVPSFFGRKGSKNNASEPFFIDIWEDPFESFSFAIAPRIPAPTYASARIDWKETPDAHVFIADVPGLKKDEVKIEVEEEKILKISGRRSGESEKKNEKWHWVERSADEFVRTVRLPPNARTDSAKAKLENGVLIVTVPKGNEKGEGGRLIEISG